MSQSNYFAYNIIDTLYFNRPDTSEYGIDNFVRRSDKDPNNQNQFNDAYDEKEKEFIQAVINKYIADHYDVEQKTFNYNKAHKGIELGDMISNVNGTHNYKLMSAKDIDFDNVILPNSVIEDDFNWGSFDINRRWGAKPIRINNTFELLNVIDYLLCACNDLWKNLYKIKYNSNEYPQIWFTKNAESTLDIRPSNKLEENDFKISSNNYITRLDPTSYYTPINNNVNNKFGFVTNFHFIEGEDRSQYDRYIQNSTNKNIINAYISSTEKIFEPSIEDTQNIGGKLQKIYGVLIGNDLKIYPGSRADAFIDSANIYYDSNKLVDFENKCLKNEVFFKISPNAGNDIYSKVYIKFLDTNLIKSKMLINDSSFVDPYFLYYISKDNNDNEIKNIISCNYRTTNPESNNIERLTQIIKNQISNTNYVFNIYDADNINNYNKTQIDKVEKIPLLYVIPNEFYSILEISTPNSVLFSSNSQHILIYYYKDNNTLKCNVSRKKNENNENIDVEIKPEYDITQINSIIYRNERYNLPTDETIYFKFDAKYVAYSYINNNELVIENPLGIKLDDEYDDVLCYYNDSMVNNIPNVTYYELTGLEDNNYFKRNFNSVNDITKISTNISIDTEEEGIVKYKHAWIKKENPYKINVRIENDELVTQDALKDKINTEISNIITNNELQQISYNEYTFRHTLSNDIEQIKLNFIFNIEATSKVNEISYIMPVNINKVYNPTINYYSYNALMKELERYSNIMYETQNNTPISLSTLYDYTFLKYGEDINNRGLNRVKNIYSYINNNGDDIESLDDLNLQKTYDNAYNNSIFEFTYDSKLNYVNLIGSWFTEQHIKKLTGGTKQTNPQYFNKGFAVTSIKTAGREIAIKSNDNEISPYIFNINGLGLNYRLHGASGIVANNLVSNNNSGIPINNIRPFYTQYDLLSIMSPNNNSINKELQIKLDDDNNQLSYIYVNSSYSWQKNELLFNSGINTSGNTYIINTIPVNIYKESYTTRCSTYINNGTISYYVPITYMQINSSTVYPPLEYAPLSGNYNLNDTTDQTRYNNYVKWWNTGNDIDDDRFYKPITLSLKLKNNIDTPNPYYYESNEAVMKFNIKRANKSAQKISVSGVTNIIYVALNSRYYLSDFVEIENGTNEGTNEKNDIPVGSYMYFDNTHHSYMIKEIYDNVNYKNTNTNCRVPNSLISGERITNPSFNTSSNNFNIPYPIFYKSSIKNNTSYYDTTQYDYDIYRISDINKAKIGQDESDNSGITVKIVKPQGSGYGELNTSALGINTNKKLLYIDFSTTDFMENFGINNTFNLIQYELTISNIYSSKNYTGTSTTTTGTKTIISPIVREKPDYDDIITKIEMFIGRSLDDNKKNEFKNIYKNKECNGQTYEFFEFKYQELYEITLNLSNNRITAKDLAPLTNNKGTMGSYNIQLIAFLRQNSDNEYSFICNKELYQELSATNSITINQ